MPMVEVEKELLDKIKHMKIMMKKKSMSLTIDRLYSYYVNNHLKMKTLIKNNKTKSEILESLKITDEDWKEIQRIKDERKKNRKEKEKIKLMKPRKINVLN